MKLTKEELRNIIEHDYDQLAFSKEDFLDEIIHALNLKESQIQCSKCERKEFVTTILGEDFCDDCFLIHLDNEMKEASKQSRILSWNNDRDRSYMK